MLRSEGVREVSAAPTPLARATSFEATAAQHNAVRSSSIRKPHRDNPYSNSKSARVAIELHSKHLSLIVSSSDPTSACRVGHVRPPIQLAAAAL
jgi:hypothetical protein